MPFWAAQHAQIRGFLNALVRKEPALDLLNRSVLWATQLLRRKQMTGKSDEIKGRVKEAAGAIADNDRLRREGQIDQAAGKLKQAAEKAVEKVQGAVKDANKR
jgi:uncharacterized protein YjbJ (UPF0337 family)